MTTDERSVADMEDGRTKPTSDNEHVSFSTDTRKSISDSEDPWQLIDQTTRKSICMEHRGSKPRMSIRSSIFLDPWEIIDEVDDSVKWAGMA